MTNKINRHFYNGADYILDKKSKKVILMPHFHQKLLKKKLWGKFGFKKIGGSSIGDVLGVDKYKSQFLAFCRIAHISIPILDRKYVDAGIAIEPKVIKLIEEVSKKKVITYDPMEYNFDFFSDKDDILGGIPDGFIPQTQTIIEIKTTGKKNFEKWKSFGVPTGYLRQAQLYAYLMNVSKYSIVATFLEEKDYLKPKNYPIKKRITKNWNFIVDMAQVQDDIEYVKNWYEIVTTSGFSSQYHENIDQDLIEWLECHNVKEWEILKNKWISSGKIKL